MGTGVRTRYHVALNGRGFMLRGAPQNPAYRKSEVRIDLSRIAPNDPVYNPMNGADWNYWAQTDWSGGFQRLKWQDDASFKDGQAVDVLTKYGDIRLQRILAVNAAAISGSFVYVGGAGTQNSKLVVGITKTPTNASRLYNVQLGSQTLVSAMAGISAVNEISQFKGRSLIAMQRTSGTLATLSRYDGTTLSGIRSANAVVRAVQGVGIRAYTAERVASLSADVLYYTTDLATFTSAYQTGVSTAKIRRIRDLNGIPYVFIEDGNSVRMFKFDEYQSKPFPIYEFADLSNWGVTNFLSMLVITGVENGVNVAYAFNGSVLRQIFRDQLGKSSSYDFSRPFVYEGMLHVHGARWDGKYWFPGLYHTFPGYGPVKPFANGAGKLFAYAVSGTAKTLFFNHDVSAHYRSGYVIGSDFGHDLGHVDKLVNSVRINCEALSAGQMIEYQRSTDGGTTFSSVGTLKKSVDGAISGKTLYFPSGFVTKAWSYKVILVDSNGGNPTPVVKDVIHEYRPMPDTKSRWSLAVQATDEVQHLNGQREERSGKELAAELWLEKQRKKTLIYEDLHYFSAKLAGSMTSANTSAKVISTDGLPRRGRVRIVASGVAEEMTYTSADGKKILGLARGQKGTLARAYTTAHAFDNAYTVLVSEIDETIAFTDEEKTESVIRLGLIEV
jgi:hypothetical protein